MTKATIVWITMFLVFIDQATKFVAVHNLKPIHSIEIVSNFFYLTFVENRGAAFGMFEGGKIFFITTAVMAVFMSIYYYNKLPDNKLRPIGRVSLILISAGAIGNMIDRIFKGYVVDMLHFIFWGNDFAVFNVADVYVCTGTFLLMVTIMFTKEDIK